MSEFPGYEKMPTSLEKLGLSEKDYSELDKMKWVVTEKVHGANFSFFYDNGKLRFAKRKSALSWQDDFFGFQLIAKQLEEHILQLFEDLSSKMAADKYIIYGELFGGEYPHPDVKTDENVQAIQTGVYYSPSIHFCAFDIALQIGQAKSYLDYETAISYFETHKIFYAKPLFVGKMTEALNFNTRIDSKIPAELGLPKVKKNLIEGIVIKPFNGPKNTGLKIRPIVKLKNVEFAEEKFHEARKWSYVPNVSSNTEELSFLVEELRNYLTPKRLESAVSKIGQLNFDDPSRTKEIENEFLMDVLEDFNENNDKILDELAAKQKAWVENRIRADVIKIIAARKKSQKIMTI